jgi:hypothetical protein
MCGRVVDTLPRGGLSLIGTSHVTRARCHMTSNIYSMQPFQHSACIRGWLMLIRYWGVDYHIGREMGIKIWCAYAQVQEWETTNKVSSRIYNIVGIVQWKLSPWWTRKRNHYFWTSKDSTDILKTSPPYHFLMAILCSNEPKDLGRSDLSFLSSFNVGLGFWI